ncbi:hypothetical protein [Streptomyces venezuelae]|uniref:hypothetical protein n=1 Tax=Streptomyces venezuelae TaxID=54571 RepID=UPI003440F458
MRSAFEAILSDARLQSASPDVQLFALVQLCKAPAAGCTVLDRTANAAGWLGQSLSNFRKTRRRVTSCGVAEISPHRDEDRQRIDGIRVRLLPLREARDSGVASPLALLNRRDLATMLAFAEAVTCPGWGPTENRPEGTPAGVMAFRKGAGAPAVRLGALLLALHCREDGTVPMRKGAVAAGYGRADATLAKLGHWPLDLAVRVLDELVSDGVAEFYGPGTRDRVRVPMVKAAHRRLKQREAVTAAVEPSSCASCSHAAPPVADVVGSQRDETHEELVLEGPGWAQPSFDDVAHEMRGAFRDQEQPEADSSGKAAGQSCASDVKDEAHGAELHASHSPVVAHSGLLSLGFGFSGSAVLGNRTLPGGARGREDQPTVDGSTAVSAQEFESSSPLRGEMPNTFRTSSPKNAFAGVQPAGQLPPDLAVALAPVADEWARLPRESTARLLIRWVEAELRTLVSLVGPENAPWRLAVRLHRRRQEHGREIRDLVGWLRSTGLPQRSGCGSAMCDDGVRLDLSPNESQRLSFRADDVPSRLSLPATCEACETRVQDKQAAYVRRMRKASGGSWKEVSRQELKRIEGKAQEQYLAQAAERSRQLAEQARLVEARKPYLEAERKAAAEQLEAWRTRPCPSCGRAQVKGECLSCRTRQRTERAVRQAVDLVVALRMDPQDPASVHDLSERVERDTWAAINKRVPDRFGAGAQADIRSLMADELLRQRRSRALSNLRQHPVVEEEARKVFRSAMWSPGASRAVAKRHAEEARTRVTHELLREFLDELVEVRRRAHDRQDVPACAAGTMANGSTA